MIEAHTLKLHPFRYYNTMSWITKSLRANKKYILDMNFLMSQNTQRYQNLYNKFYIGHLSIDDAKTILKVDLEDYKKEQRVIVAIEKKHSDEIVVTYYVQKTRKNLFLYSFSDNGKITKEKKDPFGITVTEVYHISKMMNESYKLNISDIKSIKKLLKDRFLKD